MHLTYSKYFNHAIELEPDVGHSKYMYMGQMLTGQDAIQHFQRGIELMKKILVAAKPDAGVFKLF